MPFTSYFCFYDQFGSLAPISHLMTIKRFIMEAVQNLKLIEIKNLLQIYNFYALVEETLK